MAYKIIVSPRAQKEIENAIDYYALNSSDAYSCTSNKSLPGWFFFNSTHSGLIV
jgi:hypothetical protein